MGEALSDDERALFKQLTGRREREPLRAHRGSRVVVGRRGGKSRAMATLPHTSPALPSRPRSGRARRAALHCARPEAGGHRVGLLRWPPSRPSPILSQLIADRTPDALELDERHQRRGARCQLPPPRGPTYVAVVADEAAFWYGDEFSANADSEILNAVRPGLRQLAARSSSPQSPYAARRVVGNVPPPLRRRAGDPIDIGRAGREP